MSALLQIPEAAQFAAFYAVALLILALLNKREFRRSPEKGLRYQALPIGYKAACWFIVTPLFAGTILHGVLFIPALISFAALEGACVRWYRKEGLFKNYSDFTGWSFEIDEVSAGVYQVDASSVDGQRFSRTGVDPDALLGECKLAVADLIFRKNVQRRQFKT